MTGGGLAVRMVVELPSGALMPSPAHEVPLQLLHDHPALLATLLEKLGGRAPEGVLVPVNANLRFADPAEVRPDLVFRAERPPWLLLELQNRIDPDKARRWIVAAAIQLDATGVMGEIVILTSSRRVAAWAHDVAHVRGDFGSRFELTPLVLPIVGKAIDALLDEAHPELAFFAAWAVRGRRGPRARRIVDRPNIAAPGPCDGRHERPSPRHRGNRAPPRDRQ